MAFDIDKTTNEMLSAMRGVVKNEWKDISGFAEQILSQEKDTLRELSEYFLHGKLSKEEYESELEDEKDVLRVQFNSLTTMNKALAQKAANAAIDALVKAVVKALK